MAQRRPQDYPRTRHGKISSTIPFLLRPGYENSDQVFIDAGKQAIDAYEAIFSGITIFSNPDAADDFPGTAISLRCAS